MKLRILVLKTLLFCFGLFIVSISQGQPVISSGDITGGQGGWKVLGPGGGGGVLKPTVSPFDENFVVTHCDMTAAYVSHDGGKNWNMKNLGNVPDDFEFDPADPNTLYTATRGFLHSEDRGSGISMLLRSDDRGSSWRIIYPDVEKAIRVERLQSTSLKPSDIIPGAINGTIQKVRVDPSDNNRIFIGVAPLIDYMGPAKTEKNEESAKLLLSKDRGESWEIVAELPGKGVMGIFPAAGGDQVVVITERACVRIDAIARTSRMLPLPVDRVIVVDGGRGASGDLIYLQSAFGRAADDTPGGMYVSSDMGDTWTRINEGLLNGIAKGRKPMFRQGLAVCASVPEVAYISTINPVTDNKGETEYIYTIFKTINAGKQWVPVLMSSSPNGYITGNFNGSWMEESFDPGWGGSPIDLGAAPGNPDVCYAGDNGRGYKTTDGGKTWEQVYSHNNADGSYSNSGLNVTTCYGVHFDPFDKNHFFICYTDMGLFHTFDGGSSWFHSLKDIPRDWQNTCYEVEFDPEIRGKVWSVWANAHDLPRTKMFGGPGFGSFSGGVAVSDDGGRSWHKSNNGIPENSVCTNILLDPTSPPGSRTLYVTVFARGLYKSVDGGKNWSECNKGLGSNLFAWQVRLDDNGRLYALFARGETKGKTTDGVVYVSDDKASTWEKMNLPDSMNGPHDLLIDPLHAGTMYISCWPRTINGKDYHGGVIRSTDYGLTWKQVFDERVRVNAAGLYPGTSGSVFINTFHNAAYRSEDGGNSWKRIEGYRFKWGQRAIPDVNNPGMLFLTSYGGSVFYGPSAGIPGTTDDVVNMPEGWW